MAKLAESLSLFLRLIELLEGGGISIGYRRDPHDWHKGVSFFSFDPQKEHFGITNHRNKVY